MPAILRRAFVIAHYDQAGSIRSDMVALLRKLQKLSGDVVLVSTGLSPESAKIIEPYCRVLVRPNTGYDFYSYKVGIDSLGDLSVFDEVVILNSSFLTLDPDKLLRAFIDFPREERGLLGLTRSMEFTEHLQSYFVVFSKETVGSPEFVTWWRDMLPIDSREQVIQKYEIGMSTYFLKYGYKLATIFEPTKEEREVALMRFRRLYGRKKETSSASNPTHFNWDSLLEKYGIVKIELIARNPHGLGLSLFYKKYGSANRSLINEIKAGRTRKDSIKGVRRSLRRQLDKVIG